MRLKHLKMSWVITAGLLTANACFSDIPLYNEDGSLRKIPATSNASTQSNSKKFLNPVIGQPAWDYWGLTESEWRRYEELKKSSPWAQWENTATPLAILAHYADPDTRQRYARIEAELDQWRFNQTMEYQRVYNREREIVNAAYQMAWEKRAPLIGNIGTADRTLFFVPKGVCEARCIALINPLLRTGSHLDIYVVGATEESEVFSWAKSAAIPPERVQTKHVTLNFETGILKDLNPLPVGLIDLPIAYWHREGRYEKVIF